MKLSSPKFADRDTLPKKYTCNGDDVSPPLVIEGVPKGAESLVLLFDDPDAAKEPAGRGLTWDHWVVYNIAPSVTGFDEGSIPKGCELGKNDFGRLEYGGPCPPTFNHQYFMRLFALDCKFEFPEPPTKGIVQEAMKSHVLEETVLTFFYEQPGS